MSMHVKTSRKTADAPTIIFYFRTIQMIYSIFVSCTIICQCMLTSRQTADAPTIIFYFVLHNDIFYLCILYMQILYILFFRQCYHWPLVYFCTMQGYILFLYLVPFATFYILFLGSAYHWPLVYFEPCNLYFYFVICTSILL